MVVDGIDKKMLLCRYLGSVGPGFLFGKSTMIPLAIGLVMLLQQNLAEGNTPVLLIAPEATSIEEYVNIYFSDIPVMADIAKCESRFRHFGKDGHVLRGEVTPQDIGVMQVNEYFHGTTAEKLGIDIYSIEGNVAYARYLYEKDGTIPWASSAKCWSKKANQIAKK